MGLGPKELDTWVGLTYDTKGRIILYPKSRDKRIWIASTAKLLGYRVGHVSGWGNSIISPTGSRVASGGKLDLGFLVVLSHMEKEYGIRYKGDSQVDI